MLNFATGTVSKECANEVPGKELYQQYNEHNEKRPMGGHVAVRHCENQPSKR